MNPDVLLNRIRLEQRGLIDIHKKLYEMEHLLPVPDPLQFAKTAESAALLSEKSTAHLRNMFFSVSNEPPIMYRQDSHMAVVIPFRFSRGIARAIHSTNS
mgnify:FL=1